MILDKSSELFKCLSQKVKKIHNEYRQNRGWHKLYQQSVWEPVQRFWELTEASKDQGGFDESIWFLFFPHSLSCLPLKTHNEFSSYPSYLVKNTEAKQY